MLTAEAYMRNRAKRERINDLISVANSLCERRYEMIGRIEAIFETALAELTNGMPPNSIPANPSLVVRHGNILIEKDPIKARIAEILRLKTAEFSFMGIPEMEKEKTVNRRIIHPTLSEEINLVKITAIVPHNSHICEIIYTFSEGKTVMVGFEDIIGNMIKEQTVKETRDLLKSFIMTLKSDIRWKERFLTNLKKELGHLIVAERI
jgi:hypothetical protein